MFGCQSADPLLVWQIQQGIQKQYRMFMALVRQEPSLIGVACVHALAVYKIGEAENSGFYPGAPLDVRQSRVRSLHVQTPFDARPGTHRHESWHLRITYVMARNACQASGYVPIVRAKAIRCIYIMQLAMRNEATEATICAAVVGQSHSFGVLIYIA
eukprot:9481635-Pyramimonas_sp.AAC.1